MNHDRAEKTPGVLKVDQEIAYKVEIELLRRQLADKEKAVKEASVKQVEGVCDFCLEDHPNGQCLEQTPKFTMGNRQETRLKLHLNQGSHLHWKSYSINLLT